MTNSRPIPIVLVATVLTQLLTQPLSAQITTVDDFTTPSKWTVVTVSTPAAALTVASGRMNYTTSSSANSGAIAASGNLPKFLQMFLASPSKRLEHSSYHSPN